MTDKTFIECSKDMVGTVYHSGTLHGIKYLVLRGPVSVNAYLGIPKDHPLAGKHYDEIDLHVHGRLTFGDFGEDGTDWPPGYYWIGWDYAHANDKCFYDLNYPSWTSGDREWTPDMIFKEVKQVIPDLVRLMEGNYDSR